VRYVSTRAGSTEPTVAFSDILLAGLAPDGGLYVPERYPQVDSATLADWRRILSGDGYAALAHAVLTLFVGDIPSADLLGICRRAYTVEKFGDPLDRVVQTFAEVNDMPSCAPAGDVG